MRLLVAFLLAVTPLASASASAESENEPARGQMDVLAQAIAAMSSSKIPELTSRFNETENTGYYLRDVSFMGRYPTRGGQRLLFRATFIRSSPYRIDAVTPPRGHSFIVALDDEFAVLGYQRIEADSGITVVDGKVRSDEALLFDFNAPE